MSKKPPKASKKTSKTFKAKKEAEASNGKPKEPEKEPEKASEEPKKPEEPKDPKEPEAKAPDSVTLNVQTAGPNMIHVFQDRMKGGKPDQMASAMTFNQAMAFAHAVMCEAYKAKHLAR